MPTVSWPSVVADLQSAGITTPNEWLLAQTAMGRGATDPFDTLMQNARSFLTGGQRAAAAAQGTANVPGMPQGMDWPNALPLDYGAGEVGPGMSPLTSLTESAPGAGPAVTAHAPGIGLLGPIGGLIQAGRNVVDMINPPELGFNPVGGPPGPGVGATPDPNSPDPSAGPTGVVGEAANYHRGGLIGRLARRSPKTRAINAQEGEFVMNPRATEKFFPMLQEMNTMVPSGVPADSPKLNALIERGQKFLAV